MHKYLLAVLLTIGLADMAKPAHGQVLKGSKAPTKAVESQQNSDKGNAAAKGASKTGSKLTLKQETVRNQTQKPSNSALTKGNQQANSGTCGQLTKANNQITKGNNQQITKGNNQQITKGNNQQITKGNNQQITKGNNQQITKGNNQQITKGNNQQITKGNNQQITKGNNQRITKGNNQQITKGNQPAPKN